MDTFIYVESSSRRVQALEAWMDYPLQIMTKEFEIGEIGVEEEVDLGFAIKDSPLPNPVL